MHQERKRVKPAKGEWPYVILGVVLFFGSIILFVVEINNYSFTTNFHLFLLIYGIIGLLLAIALSIYYGKGTKGVERAKLTLLFLIFITLIFPVWAHFLNRMIVIQTHTDKVEIFQNEVEEYMATNPAGVMNSVERFNMFLVYKQKILKITSSNLEHAKLRSGSTIDITIHRGIFGFEFVDNQMFR